jgi:dihydroxyacetone kinase DhaKLM complex PTS-EIIA-like component DhaM
MAGLYDSIIGGIDKGQEKLLGLDPNFLKEQIKEMKNFTGALVALDVESSRLSKSFLLGRSRVNEFKGVIADTAPLVRRLGGDIGDIVQMVEDTSTALARTVIFSPDVYEKLYALTDLLGGSSGRLIKNFSDAGISIAKVGGDIEKSISYVNSIGMNAKVVMEAVVDNVELLNRFNFKEGVLGFSKMAATAAMLKVDMQSIQTFADKVFNIEGAVETAATFQRLGVFMGDLADPFALMNSSLNGPEGLMKSIAKAGEMFTELNAETGRIEINPSAMGMFKELGDATNLGADKVKKMAIALREFNERAAEIDFKFDITDEQKMFIANLSYLNDKGEYVINVKDEKTGESIAKKVSELTDKQISKLQDLSSEKPKTMEELARESMSITDIIKNDVQAIKYKILFGAVGTPGVAEFQENVRGNLIEPVYDTLYEIIPEMKDMRSFLKNTYTDFTELFRSSTNFTTGLEKVISNIPSMDKIGEHFSKAFEKGGLNNSWVNDIFNGVKNFGTNMVTPGVGTIAPTSTGGTGGAEYDKNNQILTYMKEKETTKVNNMEFKLNIDVIHKMMDATGAVKPMGQVDKVILNSKDNYFSSQLTIGEPNK